MSIHFNADLNQSAAHSVEPKNSLSTKAKVLTGALITGVSALLLFTLEEGCMDVGLDACAEELKFTVLDGIDHLEGSPLLNLVTMVFFTVVGVAIARVISYATTQSSPHTRPALQHEIAEPTEEHRASERHIGHVAAPRTLPGQEVYDPVLAKKQHPDGIWQCSAYTQKADGCLYSFRLKTGFLDESSADDHVSKNLFPAIELHPRILANTRFRISTFELRERARRSKSGDILEGSAFGRLGFQLCFDKPQDLPAVKACTLVLPDLDYLKAQWKSLREDYPELQLPPLTIAPSKGIASNLDFIQTLIANDALVSDAAEFVHDMQIHVLAVISQRFGDKIDTQIAFINLYRELRQTWNELWPRYPLAFAGLPELPVTASNSRIALEKILAALIRAPLGVLAKQDAEPLHQLKQLCIKAVKTREQGT